MRFGWQEDRTCVLFIAKVISFPFVMYEVFLISMLDT